jgi:hypothetical protein
METYTLDLKLHCRSCLRSCAVPFSSSSVSLRVLVILKAVNCFSVILCIIQPREFWRYPENWMLARYYASFNLVNSGGTQRTACSHDTMHHSTSWILAVPRELHALTILCIIQPREFWRYPENCMLSRYYTSFNLVNSGGTQRTACSHDTMHHSISW